MEYKNMIHPEEEYIAFGKMLIDLVPELDEELEDQDIIDMYNQMKNEDPNITPAQIQQVLPGIVGKIKEQVLSGDGEGNLEALQSIGA